MLGESQEAILIARHVQLCWTPCTPIAPIATLSIEPFVYVLDLGMSVVAITWSSPPSWSSVPLHRQSTDCLITLINKNLHRQSRLTPWGTAVHGLILSLKILPLRNDIFRLTSLHWASRLAISRVHNPKKIFPIKCSKSNCQKYPSGIDFKSHITFFQVFTSQ